MVDVLYIFRYIYTFKPPPYILNLYIYILYVKNNFIYIIMDYFTAIEIIYVMYTNQGLINYGIKKIIKETNIVDKLIVESTKYIFKKINFNY